MSFPDIVPDLKAAMPDLKGRLAANVQQVGAVVHHLRRGVDGARRIEERSAV